MAEQLAAQQGAPWALRARGPEMASGAQARSARRSRARAALAQLALGLPPPPAPQGRLIAVVLRWQGSISLASSRAPAALWCTLSSEKT